MFQKDVPRGCVVRGAGLQARFLPKSPTYQGTVDTYAPLMPIRQGTRRVWSPAPLDPRAATGW